jgi:hypothetical protein
MKGASMKKWWANGGKRELFYVGLLFTIICSLLKTVFAMGDYKRQAMDTIQQVSVNKACIEVIKENLMELKIESKETRNDVAWIKEHLRRNK